MTQVVKLRSSIQRRAVITLSIFSQILTTACPSGRDMRCLLWFLTHWGRVTHICDNKLTIIGSDNGLSPERHQAIIWTNAGILLIGPLGTNFSEMLIEIHTFSFKKIHLKLSSGKWRPFCLGLNVLNLIHFLLLFLQCRVWYHVTVVDCICYYMYQVRIAPIGNKSPLIQVMAKDRSPGINNADQVPYITLLADELHLTYITTLDELGYHLMMSSNGNIFRVTGPLCGEFTDQRRFPLTKASDAELWCFLWSAPEQTVE